MRGTSKNIAQKFERQVIFVTFAARFYTLNLTDDEKTATTSCHDFGYGHLPCSVDQWQGVFYLVEYL